jgi:hypothetical protein
MHSAAMLVVALVAQAPQDNVGIPAHPVSIAGFERASCVAAAGAWVAFVRVLPLSEEDRMLHAPRPPWELVRMGPGGPPEVLIESGTTRSGWGAPSFVAAAGDGTVVATWRGGYEVLIAPPGQPAARHFVHAKTSLECIAISTKWVLLGAESGALSGRELATDGVRDEVAVGAGGPRGAEGVVLGGPWLAWLDSTKKLAVLHVDRRERRTIELPGENVVVDGIWNGHLFAHECFEPTPLVHVVDLERAEVRSLRAPGVVRACTPEGVFGSSSLWDPASGQLTRIELLLSAHPRTLFRRAPGVLWARDASTHRWLETRLDAPAVPLKIAVPAPLPKAPPQPDGEAAESARAAWRAAREPSR